MTATNLSHYELVRK